MVIYQHFSETCSHHFFEHNLLELWFRVLMYEKARVRSQKKSMVSVALKIIILWHRLWIIHTGANMGTCHVSDGADETRGNSSDGSGKKRQNNVSSLVECSG